jgi:hypothetical protein
MSELAKPLKGWASYTPEQKQRYNANRRAKYKAIGRPYKRTPEQAAVYNERRAERRRNDPVWREKDNARKRGRDQRHTQLKTHYGISKAQYDEMLASQGGNCGICGNDPKETLCVDHCHSTGKVRALLCRSCNTGLGCFKDNSQLLLAAIKYLEESHGN